MMDIHGNPDKSLHNEMDAAELGVQMVRFHDFIDYLFLTDYNLVIAGTFY